MKIMKAQNSIRNQQDHENYIITEENHKDNEKLKIPHENYENIENH